jgi:two-component system, OmpR family, phosphate regulon sensor histidine kinase PhoR
VSVRHRLAAGFAVLLVLFLSLVFLQLVVDERLDRGHADRAARIAAVRDLNRAARQNMTDAETGVRGFQLTGETTYLDPY